MKHYELMDNGENVYAVGPFGLPEEVRGWAGEAETATVTLRGFVNATTHRVWTQHLKQRESER